MKNLKKWIGKEIASGADGRKKKNQNEIDGEKIASLPGVADILPV